MGLYPPITDLFTGFSNVLFNDPVMAGGFTLLFLVFILVISGIKGNTFLYLSFFCIVGVAGWSSSAVGVNIDGIAPQLRPLLVLAYIVIVGGVMFGILRMSGLLR